MGSETSRASCTAWTTLFPWEWTRSGRPDNPVHSVIRFANGRCDRRLSEGEYAALDGALRRGDAEGIWPAAIALSRFLVLAGAAARLWPCGGRISISPGARPGSPIQNRPINSANVACGVRRSLPRIIASELAFPATRGEGQMIGFPEARFWEVCWRADNKLSAFTATVGNGACARLSCAIGTGEGRWEQRIAG
jgi:hypothetical protein